MELSLVAPWVRMGSIAWGVVLALLLISAAAASVAVRKLLQLRRARRATRRLGSHFAAALADGNLAAAERLLTDSPQSHAAAALHGVLGMLDLPGPEQPLSGSEIAAARRMIEMNTLERRAEMRQGLGVLATVGATAPLVGLLGTIAGVAHALGEMATDGSAGLGAIPAEIATALVLAALGLLVALPFLWLHSYLVGETERATLEMSCAGKLFLGFLLRRSTRQRAETQSGSSPSR